MKEVFNKYINNKTKLEKYQQIGIIALIIVLAVILITIDNIQNKTVQK